MTIVRRLRALVLTLTLPFTVAGCAFGLPCDLFGSLLQRQMLNVDVCSSFNGACCDDVDPQDGLPDECSGIFGASPCARFDTDECFCTTGIGFGLGDPQGQTLVPEPAAYALPPDADFFVSLSDAGLSGTHRAFFDTEAQDLQTRQAVLTYPDQFGFNGFLALGPPETVIGAFAVDFDLDFDPDLTLPLRALTADTAYVDGNLDGRFDPADPSLVHTTGSHVFTATLPRGGDGLARTKVGRLVLRTGVALYAGILVNPTTPGTYQVTGTFTSVDPESGDADDATGVAPTSFAAPPVDVEVSPPSYGTLSPFLCYATKPTKGTLCNGTAATNAGGACATDADCGGTAGACVKSPLAKGLTVNARDDQAFGPEGFVVGKPATLCTPAEVDGGGVPADETTHFRGYQGKAAKGAPKYFGIEAQTVVNALGTVAVTTTKRDRLLMASVKSLGAPLAMPLPPKTLEHMQCHKVKLVKKVCAENTAQKCKKSADCGVAGPCLGAFPKNRTVEVGDQFTTFAAPRRLTIVKPTRLCYPADVNGSGVDAFGQDLLCYAVKPAPGSAKHAPIVGQIHTTNVLARERANTVKESELCLPSVLTGII